MKKHLIFAAALLALAACNNEEYNPTDDPNAPVEICLSSGIDVQTRANSAEVPDKQIAEGQQVGVFINDAGNGDVVGDNLKYNADGTGGLALATDLAQETPYYPATGNGVKITAYHPYNTDASIDGSYNFYIHLDQSIDKNYCQSDLLYSSATYPRQREAHNIAFKHKLSKVECTLRQGAGMPDLTGAAVTILGSKAGVTLNCADGTVNVFQDISTNVKLNSTITPGSYIGIIPPQTFDAGSKFLEVKQSEAAGGGAFHYTLPEGGLALAEGKVYKYDITVNRTGLKVESSITDWGLGETHSGDAEMQ